MSSRLVHEALVFGALPDGRTARRYVLTNGCGMRVEISDFGGIVLSIRTPDREGRADDVVLGYDRLEDYVRDTLYFGCLVGRTANRTGGGRLRLPDGEFLLTKNERGGHLHGGARGFHKVLWNAAPFETDRARGVELTHRSPDGDEGYPGNLSVSVTYTLTNEDEIAIDYRAESDRDTAVNLTHHSYFNLAGAGRGDIQGHVLALRARRFTPTDALQVPTGDLRRVAGTPFDFTTPTLIGTRIDAVDDQLRLAGGYDHNWVLDDADGSLRTVATALCPSTGRALDVSTTEPGLQFYAGNAIPRDVVGRGGAAYGPRSGFCLETQHFPDAPNKPHFPSTLLRRGDVYRSRTVYRFFTRSADAALEVPW